VGGVRQIPEGVVRFLEGRRAQAGYLLLIDEVQTGMYRTGPFTRSGALGLTPDLLLLGKGTSDMMFPFSLVLHGEAVQQKLEAAGSDLTRTFRARYGYEAGYQTVCNVLDQARELDLGRRVSEAGALFQQLLTEGLAGCKSVREVRVFGLLIGIELNPTSWPRRLFQRRLYSLYLYGMLRHAAYPVLAGFCQYEPNVLKLTPALTVSPEEIRRVCGTLIDVLGQPFHRLLTTAFAGLFRSLKTWRKTHERHRDPAAGLAAR
jgi:acetylornithine/succinyldiaminopimelate/putrescine aminotransferase